MIQQDFDESFFRMVDLFASFVVKNLQLTLREKSIDWTSIRNHFNVVTKVSKSPDGIFNVLKDPEQIELIPVVENGSYACQRCDYSTSLPSELQKHTRSCKIKEPVEAVGQGTATNILPLIVFV